MTATTTTFDSVLKEFYLPGIRDVLNSKVNLYNIINRDSENIDLVGRRGIIAFNRKRNAGIGTRRENTNLPTAGRQGYSNAYFDLRYLYGSLEVTGQAMTASRNDTGALAKVLETESKGLTRDVLKDMNRMCFGDGSGIMADPANGGAAPGGNAGTTLTVDSLQYLSVGDIVDIAEFSAQYTGTADPTINSGNSGLEITAIDRATKVLTFAAAFGTNCTANSRIVRTGNAAFEPYGLAAIMTVNGSFSTATNIGYGVPNFGLIDRSSGANEWFRASVLHNSGTLRAPSYDLLTEAQDTADIEGDGMINLYLMDHAVYRACGRVLVPDRRYTDTGGRFKLMDGGYGDLENEGVALVKDRDCQPNRIWCLDTETLLMFEPEDFNWIDEDGSILTRTGKDSFTATLRKYCQLGCSDPRNNVVIVDVSTAN